MSPEKPLPVQCRWSISRNLAPASGVQKPFTGMSSMKAAYVTQRYSRAQPQGFRGSHPRTTSTSCLSRAGAGAVSVRARPDLKRTSSGLTAYELVPGIRAWLSAVFQRAVKSHLRTRQQPCADAWQLGGVEQRHVVNDKCLAVDVLLHQVLDILSRNKENVDNLNVGP